MESRLEREMIIESVVVGDGNGGGLRGVSAIDSSGKGKSQNRTTPTRGGLTMENRNTHKKCP